MAGRDIILTDQGGVIFREEETYGTNQVSIRSQATMSDGDYEIRLPAAKPGSSGRILNVDVSGDIATCSFVLPANAGMAGLSALAYGASGDGSDNDSTHINHATDGIIEKSQTSGAGGSNERIVFPAGTYRLDDIDSFEDDENYWIEGAGMGASILKAIDGASNHMFDAQAEKILVFRNLTFDGNALQNIMLEATAPYIFIDNVEFTNGCKAIKITGAPKVVAITNCRFHTNVAGGVGPMIDMTSLSASETTVIFRDNYVEGGVPATDGVGTSGLEVASTGISNTVRCIIRGNHFRELGVKAGIGSIKIRHAHDSVIDTNVFSKIISTPISVETSDRVRITGNKIVSDSTKVEDAQVIYGILITSFYGNTDDLVISENNIVGTTTMDIGIAITGVLSPTPYYIRGVSISDNSITGTQVPLYVEHVKGQLNIVRNNLREFLTHSDENADRGRAALSIGNILGNANVLIEGNSFIGGAASGRAIHWDRTVVGDTTAGQVHATLKDNLMEGLGKGGGWTKAKALDMAVIYIRGGSSTDLISNFNATGNRYDFTGSVAGTYGMYVDNINEICTFDSVLEFGALGDGSTDCTMAFSRAALAAKAGGSIYVPAGTYNVDDYGTAQTASVNGYSAGPTETAIAPTLADQVWHGEGTIHDAESSSVKDLFKPVSVSVTLRGLSFTTAGSNGGSCIFFTGADSVADDLTLTGFNTGLELTGDRSAVLACKLTDCGSTDSHAILSVAADPAEDVNIYNNTIKMAAMLDNTQTGIGGVLVRGTITNNTINNVGGCAIDVTGSNGALVQGNVIQDVGSIAIKTTDTTSALAIVGNTITRAFAAADTLEIIVAASRDISLKNTTDSTITGNTIVSPVQHIYIHTGCSTVAITGNVLTNNNTGSTAFDAIKLDDVAANSLISINGNTITAGVISGAGVSGIYLAADYSSITSSIISNYVVGITIPSGADNNRMVGNIMKGQTTRVTDDGSSNLDIATGGDGLTVPDTTHTNVTATGQLGGNIIKFGPSGGSLYSSAGTIASGKITSISCTDSTPTASDSLNATIDATSSFEVVKATDHHKTLYVIKIAGKHTRVTLEGGDDTEALATLEYDGMLMWMAVVGDYELRVDGLTAGGDTSYPGLRDGPTASYDVVGAYAGAGANLVVYNTDNKSLVDYPPGTSILWRFEHDGTQGIWRLCEGGNT